MKLILRRTDPLLKIKKLKKKKNCCPCKICRDSPQSVCQNSDSIYSSENPCFSERRPQFMNRGKTHIGTALKLKGKPERRFFTGNLVFSFSNSIQLSSYLWHLHRKCTSVWDPANTPGFDFLFLLLCSHAVEIRQYLLAPVHV